MVSRKAITNITCFIATIVFASIPASSTFADYSGKDGKKWIEISTAEDLYNVRADLSANYVLIKDIDLGEFDSWKTIGNEGNSFTGILDGNGYSITNYNSKIGSLIYDNDGEICNLTIDGEISGIDNFANPYYGGFASKGSGKFINCQNNVNIDLNNVFPISDNDGSNYQTMKVYAGGIVGLADGAYLVNCTNNANISCKAGNGKKTKNISGTSERYYYSAYACAGGITASGWANIEKSVNNGNIISGITDAVNHSAKAYGIGSTQGEDLGKIVDCINTGYVECTNRSSFPEYPYAMGIGQNAVNCINTGKIQYIHTYEYPMVQEYTRAYNGCAIGLISGQTDEIIDCYYLEGTDVENIHSGGSSLSEKEFSLYSSFIGFDFDSVWYMGNKTPELYHNAEKILITRRNSSIEVGEQEEVLYKSIPYNMTDNVSWYSSDENIIQVDTNGKITAVGKGSTTITARAENGIESSIDIDVCMNEYKLNYHLNGGSNDSINPSIFYYSSKDIQLNSPSREGYLFDGWFLDPDYNNQIRTIMSKTKGSLDLYAKWVPITYSISYFLDGGNNSVDNPYIFTVESENITLHNPAKDKCDFVAWYTDEKFENRIIEIKSGTVGNITLFAKYIPHVHVQKTTEKIAPSCTEVGYSEGVVCEVCEEIIKESIVLPALGHTIVVDKAVDATLDETGLTEGSHCLVCGEVIVGQEIVSKLTLFDDNYFVDVKKGKYYTDSINYLNARGVMTGLNKTEFGFGEKLSREDMVTLLWKNEGKPVYSDFKLTFKDVIDGKYYTNAVKWAKKFDIVSGYTAGDKAGLFGKGDTITRQDFVKILYGYAQYKGYSTKVSSATKYMEKTDANLVSNYAKESINWGYSNGFIGNNSDLNPKGNITRQDAAVIIARFLQKYDEIDKKSVLENTQYYIFYELNGGTNNSSNPDKYISSADSIALYDAKKDGHEFEGWYTDKDYINKITVISKGYAGDKTLYAKWGDGEYYISFDGNGADSGKMTELTCKYSQKYDLPANLFTRKLYMFGGWNTKKDGSGDYYDDKSSVSKLSDKCGENVVLYAQWIPIFNYTLMDKISQKTDKKIAYGDKDGGAVYGCEIKYNESKKQFEFHYSQRGTRVLDGGFEFALPLYGANKINVKIQFTTWPGGSNVVSYYGEANKLITSIGINSLLFANYSGDVDRNVFSYESSIYKLGLLYIEKALLNNEFSMEMLGFINFYSE